MIIDVKKKMWGRDVSLWGTVDCVFLQCTEWYLYKYYKKILFSLENVRH